MPTPNPVYMYVTNSLPFEEQKNLDLVITSDLENFEIVRDILDMSTFKCADFAVWAPTEIEKDGKFTPRKNDLIA